MYSHHWILYKMYKTADKNMKPTGDVGLVPGLTDKKGFVTFNQITGHNFYIFILTFQQTFCHFQDNVDSSV